MSEIKLRLADAQFQSGRDTTGVAGTPRNHPERDFQDRALTLVLNHLPPRELNPNQSRRNHWTTRSKVTNTAKDEIGWLVKEAGWQGPIIQKARISFEFHLKNRKRRDLDGLFSACKPYQDALVSMGVLVDDGFEHLEIGSIRATVTGTEQTIITVEELR